MRADLAEYYGVDLVELWQTRRWRALVQLIDQLPPTSRTQVAQAEDHDLARDLVKAGLVPDEPPEWTPPLREYDTVAAILQQILDTLAGANYQRAQGKGSKPKPSPRPVTAIEKARKQLDQDTQREFLNYLLANQQQPGEDGDGVG